MLKLKLQYFGYLMQRADSLEKTLMLQKVEGRKRREQQRMRWLDGTAAETGTRETKHHTRRVGELRFIMPAGPEELTLQTLSPEQRGYGVFIHKRA